jgi:hypothetical protein
MLQIGAVDVRPVISGVVGLRGLTGTLEDLGSGNTDQAKVLVDPWSAEQAA